eukprot:1909558-Pleurochrysis_carterae.AAC.4
MAGHGHGACGAMYCARTDIAHRSTLADISLPLRGCRGKVVQALEGSANVHQTSWLPQLNAAKEL